MQAHQGAKKYASLENFKRMLSAFGECVALNSHLELFGVAVASFNNCNAQSRMQTLFNTLDTPDLFVDFQKVFIHIKCNSFSREWSANFGALWQQHLTLILFHFACWLVCFAISHVLVPVVTFWRTSKYRKIYFYHDEQQRQKEWNNFALITVSYPGREILTTIQCWQLLSIVKKVSITNV